MTSIKHTSHFQVHKIIINRWDNQANKNMQECGKNPNNFYLSFIDWTEIVIVLNKAILTAKFIRIKKVKKCPVQNKKIKWNSANAKNYLQNKKLKVQKCWKFEKSQDTSLEILKHRNLNSWPKGFLVFLLKRKTIISSNIAPR